MGKYVKTKLTSTGPKRVVLRGFLLMCQGVCMTWSNLLWWVTPYNHDYKVYCVDNLAPSPSSSHSMQNGGGKARLGGFITEVDIMINALRPSNSIFAYTVMCYITHQWCNVPISACSGSSLQCFTFTKRSKVESGKAWKCSSPPSLLLVLWSQIQA